MTWLETAHTLRERGTSFVLVTIAQVRGHAPRGAGSKMVVVQDQTFSSVGGGNLEETAVEKARALLSERAEEPELLTVTLNPRGGDHGVQCCGGEVTLLLEPVLSQRPCVAVFGAGHVGWALVQVLGTLPVELYLVDSRAAQLDECKLPSPLTAQVRLRHAPVPESALASLPDDTHLLILTHDHAEDLAVLERALRRPFPFVGLIGSRTKWAHFQRELKAQGFTDEELARVVTPIGLPDVPGKSPQAVAIATAAQLLTVVELPETLF